MHAGKTDFTKTFTNERCTSNTLEELSMRGWRTAEGNSTKKADDYMCVKLRKLSVTQPPPKVHQVKRQRNDKYWVANSL